MPNKGKKQDQPARRLLIGSTETRILTSVIPIGYTNKFAGSFAMNWTEKLVDNAMVAYDARLKRDLYQRLLGAMKALRDKLLDAHRMSMNAIPQSYVPSTWDTAWTLVCSCGWTSEFFQGAIEAGRYFTYHRKDILKTKIKDLL